MYARILRPPAHGSKLVDLDVSGIEAVAGATVVRDRELLAVLHATPDGAERALATIKAEWATPRLDLDEDSIFEHLVKVAPAAETVASGGSLAVGRETGGEGVERTYLDGYVAHAPIETHTAIAEVAEGRLHYLGFDADSVPAADRGGRGAWDCRRKRSG